MISRKTILIKSFLMLKYHKLTEFELLKYEYVLGFFDSKL